MPRLAGRALIGAVAVACTLVLVAPAAAAHALPESSDPAAGAVLKQAPTSVTIVFGETPDAKLSRLRVLDSSGRDHSVGPTHAVPASPRTLTVGVGPLSDGVYTVSWRTVSEVDGHLAAGTFSFGVGVAPTGAPSNGGSPSTSSLSNPSVASVVARWLLYAGLMGLVGGTFVALVCTRSQPPRLLLLLAGAWLVAAVGAVGTFLDARSQAHLPWSQLFGSSLGRELEWRAIPIIVAGVAIVPAVASRASPRRQILVGLVGLAGLAAMWGDVEASHASAAGSLRLLRVGDQWAHFAAAGIWVGGLVTLLALIGPLPRGDRLQAAKRFSTAALASVVVIAATGFQRAYDEVGTIHKLVHTAFGQYVLVKVALFTVLIGLGFVNRYRSVPRAAGSSRPLQRMGRVELLLMALVLVATGILLGLAPPSTVAAASGVHPVVQVGHDFATTVRVTLTITPGTVGFNEFGVKAVDFDTGAPVAGTAALRFTLPARPDLGSSTLQLAPTGPGVFARQGANLSIDGIWSVDVDIQQASGGVEIPFTVTPRRPPEKIVVAPQGPGVPTLYTLELAGGASIQTYLDPGRAGLNEFHVTFIGADGQELPMSALTVTATPGGTLTVRRLDPVGHFVADLNAALKGQYRFDVTGMTQTGNTLPGTFTIPVR
ncbi:MAG TPA: copper resistance protein CopC [Acidimicrobiales bacterium]|nr:copper resistance protein CopC [Acidimicrobiales bacterium]